MKSEFTAVWVSTGYTKAAAAVGDKWADSQYSLVAGPVDFLTSLERSGEDDPNVVLKDW